MGAESEKTLLLKMANFRTIIRWETSLKCNTGFHIWGYSKADVASPPALADYLPLIVFFPLIHCFCFVQLLLPPSLSQEEIFRLSANSRKQTIESMASPTSRITFHIVIAVLLLLALFYVGRPLYWKISATIHDIRHNKQTVQQGNQIERAFFSFLMMILIHAFDF